MLSEPFSEKLFSDVTESLIGHQFTKDDRKISVSPTNKCIDDIKNLGYFKDLNLQVLIVKQSKKNEARVALSKELFGILKAYSFSNALIATYTDSSPNWRYSLLTSSLDITESGKVARKFSNPKRYSYLLGPKAKIATPSKFLVKMGKVADFNDLQKRFSVEVVNNEFYKEIAKLYDELVGTQDKVALLKYPGSEEERHQFAVRLIGRIVFCWFLREKHSEAGIPLVSREILSLEATNTSSYYHSILAPLFFEVLNKHKEKRPEKFRDGAFGNVPYLNGGLFSPQYDDHYKFDVLIGESVPGLVYVPDEWIQSLFELLETYNFTVDENTSVDIDLSIDPEMLGRIFENLLARINPETGETVRKSTGSFYTPREMVEYMVDESLIQYLLTKTKLDEKKLRALISYDLNDDLDNPLEDKEKQIVVNALGEVKILDPACGSGAFPIGILQKIVFALQQVDPQAKFWFKNQIDNTPPELRHLLEREFEHKNFDYIRKLGVIRESIFGVDIQPIATEIARLRCFLTLIVDERVDDSEDNRGVEPLPNLDFKFVTANTLIKLNIPKHTTENQANLFEDQSGIDDLKQLRDEYFNSHNSERETLKLQFSQVQNRMLQKMIANHSHGFTDLTQKLSSWDPFSHNSTSWFDPEWMFGIVDGFDVVIGNPPYVQLQKSGGVLANLYKDLKYETFTRTGDIYSLFYERGLGIAKLYSGLLCFITSNKWMRAGYGEKTRAYFANKNPLQLIDFGGFKVFESATVDTNILLIQNNTNNRKLKAVRFEKNFNKDQSIGNYFSNNEVVLSKVSGDIWFVASEEEMKLKQKIDEIGTPLKNWNIKINRGILTGCNEAFIINSTTRENLIKKDSKSVQIIKPLLRGKDVKRFSFDFKNIYVLATGYDIDVKSNYPVVYEYINHIGKQIQNGLIKVKGKGVFERDDQGRNWWNLRACNYYNEFEKEKIIYSEIVHEPQFYLDYSGEFYVEATSFIMTGENLELLVGILNSKPLTLFFRRWYAGGGLGDKGLRYKKQFLENLPIPRVNSENKEIAKDISNLVRKIQKTQSQTEKTEISKQIDQLVNKLYKLSPEDLKVIDDSIV